MSPVRSWQRALDVNEQLAARNADVHNARNGVAVEHPTPINLGALVAELLESQKFATARDAIDAAEREVVRRAGRPLTSIESARVAIDMGCALNARAKARAAEDRRRDSEWLADFQAGGVR